MIQEQDDQSGKLRCGLAAPRVADNSRNKRLAAVGFDFKIDLIRGGVLEDHILPDEAEVAAKMSCFISENSVAEMVS